MFAVLLAVVVFKGQVLLDKPIVLTPEDSGKVFVGEDGAVLSGGVRLGPWTEVAAGVWEAEAPREADGQVSFVDELWVNGCRAPCARLPNEGYLKIVGASCTNVAENLYRETVTFGPGEAEALGAVPSEDLPFVQMALIHKWSHGRRAVKAYDGATRTVVTEAPDPQDVWTRWLPDFTLVWFENVRSAFDAPGEWFLDMKAGKVRYRPRAGESIESLEIVVPHRGLSKLVEFRGDPDAGRYVENVTFRNMTFAYSASQSDGNFPRPQRQLQAACFCDGTVALTGAKNCVFENCRIEHTGNYGMRFGDGCLSNRVVNCEFEDIGAGGIWMGEEFGSLDYGTPRPNRPISRKIIRPDRPYATAFNLISNCLLQAVGRYNPEGTAIAITHCSDTKVVHNEIHDVYYTGISVGWTWGFMGSVAQRNEIAFNRIWDLGKSVMSDMGGIYTLGTSFGTTVHDNVIHDVRSCKYGGWGLYCDEGSEGIVLERNVCWNTTDGGFHMNYGSGCIVRNNIFAWNRMTGAVRMASAVRQDIPCSLHFVNNIVIVRDGPLCGRGVRKVGGIWAHNLWWDCRGETMAELDGLTWREWKDCEKEIGGEFADPMFEDAAANDWRLKNDSPAFKLGFKAWDWTKAGRVGARTRIPPFEPGERIVFLGDSITHGGHYIFDLQLFAALRHPGTKIRCINAGIGGETTAMALRRYDWDFLAKEPTRAFVMFGMNDVNTGNWKNDHPTPEVLKKRNDSLISYTNNLSVLMDRLQTSKLPACFMTPTPYDQYSDLKVGNDAVANEQGLTQAAARMRALMDERRCEYVELHRPLTRLYKEYPERHFCPDRVHPGKEIHLLMAAYVLEAMGYGPTVASVEIDARTRKSRTENASVSSVESRDDAISFRYVPKSLPYPMSSELARDEALYPFTKKLNCETLCVKGLAAGEWELAFDGKVVGTFTAEAFSNGVNLAYLETPNQLLARKAGAVAGLLQETESARRALARCETFIRARGADPADERSADAALDRHLAQLAAEKSPWVQYFTNCFSDYRKKRTGSSQLAARSEALYGELDAVRPVASQVTLRAVKRSPRGGALLRSAFHRDQSDGQVEERRGSDDCR